MLNPQRILKEIEDVLNYLPTRSPETEPPVTLRFLIHCCCMVERIVINRKPLQMALENRFDLDARAFSVIKSSFCRLKRLTLSVYRTQNILYLRTAPADPGLRGLTPHPISFPLCVTQILARPLLPMKCKHWSKEAILTTTVPIHPLPEILLLTHGGWGCSSATVCAW